MSQSRSAWLSIREPGAGLRGGIAVRCLALLVVSATLPALSSPALGEDDPWSLLLRFRHNLEAESPLTADFVQSYLPEGFSSGESESGSLALSLPECLRWDYDEPYPKSFILCGDVLHYWNEGEAEGHREEIDAAAQPGLDLMLLDVDSLRSRYEAEPGRGSETSAQIVLRPRESNDYLAEATLTFDAAVRHLVELRYLDQEGNRTSFQLTDYRRGVEAGTFNPPPEVVWNEF